MHCQRFWGGAQRSELEGRGSRGQALGWPPLCPFAADGMDAASPSAAEACVSSSLVSEPGVRLHLLMASRMPLMLSGHNDHPAEPSQLGSGPCDRISTNTHKHTAPSTVSQQESEERRVRTERARQFLEGLADVYNRNPGRITLDLPYEKARRYFVNSDQRMQAVPDEVERKELYQVGRRQEGPVWALPVPITRLNSLGVHLAMHTPRAERAAPPAHPGRGFR